MAAYVRIFLTHCGMGLFVALPLLLFPAAPVHAQTPPVFEEDDCAAVADLAAWRDDLRCGYVDVPERRLDVTDPSAVNTIRLAVVVLPATDATPADDPLFVAQGGPGGSTIDVFTDLLLGSPLRDRRDIVLFDQRGTLYSDPNLICTEMQARKDELFMASDEEYPALLAQVTSDCRARLTAAGIDVAAYNSLENAADVDDIRRALGYADINFYGVSYGTLLGFHLMRMFPDHLRSVILDGVVPPQVNFITESAASEERVFAAFFAACAADEACVAEYGDLETRFFDLVDALNAEPVELRVLHPDGGPSERFAFYGDDLIDFFYQLFYWSGSPGILPKVLVDAEAGRFGYIEAILASIIFDDTFSDGMYNSVICTEDVDFAPAEVNLDGVRPSFSAGFVEELHEYIVACELWQVPPFGAEIDAPVASDIPTLLLSGAFDPITPPAFAAAAAASLPNSRNVVLATGGHGVAFGTDPCVDDIVDAFLAAPAVAPDDACLETVALPAFVAPNVVVVPLLSYLNALNRTALTRLGWLGLLLAVVLSAYVVWPTGWLVRNLQGRALTLTSSARWARLLVLAYGLIAAAFVTLLTLVIIFGTFGDEKLLMLGAVPAGARWIFWLTWLLVGLAVFMTAALLSMWRHRQGTWARRLYYLVLTGAAVGFVALLAETGFLGLPLP